MKKRERAGRWTAPGRKFRESEREMREREGNVSSTVLWAGVHKPL